MEEGVAGSSWEGGGVFLCFLWNLELFGVPSFSLFVIGPTDDLLFSLEGLAKTSWALEVETGTAILAARSLGTC